MTSSIKNLISGLAILSICFLMSCSTTQKFTNSSIVPGAVGEVKIKQDKNKNYSINLKVSNLAPADKLQPPMSNYIVWMETSGNPTQNLGLLKTASPLFMKAYKASLKTVSTFRPSKIFITAENGADLQYPQGQTVLTTESFSVK